MSQLLKCYAERRYAERRYAECRYAVCRYAVCRYAESGGAISALVKSLYVIGIVRCSTY